MEALGPGKCPQPDRRQTEKRLVIDANKADLEGASGAFQELLALYGQSFPVVLTSATEMVGLEGLGREIFRSLGVIRVYTTSPGSEPSFDNPLVLPQGSAVEDAATSIHKEWRRKLKYALVWGSTKFDGQRVGSDYVLADGDVLQLHG
jgi:ribosome-interacting GTPase 1